MKERTPREAEFKALMKRLAARDPILADDDTIDKLIEREMEEKRNDRIYYVVLCLDALAPIAGVTINDDEEDLVKAELLGIGSAFGRFGLAVLNKKKDPFSRLEEANRIALSIKKEIETKRRETDNPAKDS
ncbi:MAG: hypothetical protein NTX14_04020 [Candidatus Nealsonbacteria bacterium]|nr:hypothetical protein [Candidatus Nealsonbacteria bacterium]